MPQSIRLAVVWGALLAAAGPASEHARAQEPASLADTLVLTLAQAQQLALDTSPVLSATALEADRARGELREARQLPNPEVDVEAPSVSTSSLGPYQVTIGQTIEWAGQRGLRIRAAEDAAERTTSDVRNAARELVRDVAHSYLRAAAGTARLDVAEQVLDSNERLLAAVRAQLGEGKISPLQANLAEIEYGRARARALAARRELASSILELKERIGLEPRRPVRVTLPEDRPAVSLPREDSLVSQALRRRPDIVAKSAALSEATSRLELARREAVPNLTLGPMAERDDASSPTRIGLTFGLPLPLWNRNAGAVAQQSAIAEQAAYEQAALELTVRMEVHEALGALRSAQEEVEVFRNAVLAPVRDNQELIEVAYTAGKIDLPSLLLLRNQLLDAEVEYWDAWLAREQAWIRLQSATGSFDLGGRDPGSLE